MKTLAAVLLCAARVWAGEDALTCSVSGVEKARMTAAELAEKAGAENVEFSHPFYGKLKRFRCVPLAKAMALAFGEAWLDLPQTEAILTARDGYGSYAKAAKLAEPGGCLAISDLDFPDWEPVGRKQANPGPFYLVWTKPEQTMANEYPWPYQLASINLVRFEERYPEVVPQGAKPGSPAYRGYEIFKGRCVHCHSINREGGKIGPDLNAPQSIAAYRSKEMIKAYIRQPSRFRYTEMPDHTDLSDKDLEDLYAYFALKRRQPEKDPLK